MFLDTQLGGISAMEPSQPRLTSVRGMARMAGIPSAVCMPGDPTIQLPPDEELIGRIALEDKDAFSLFYDRHSSRLLTLVCAILHDPAESEDVLQEAFLLIWTKAHAYDPRIAKPFTWAVTLTRNKAIDRLRSRQRRETLLTSADATGGLHTLEVPASTVRSHLSSGDGEAISTALGQLPPDQRAVRRCVERTPSNERCAVADQAAFAGRSTSSETEWIVRVMLSAWRPPA